MKNKLPFYKKPWFVISALFVMFVIALNIGTDSTSNSQPSTATTFTAEPEPDKPETLYVENLGSHWNEYGNILYITGSITNTRDHTIKGVGVRVNLYDSNGNIIGNAVDYIQNIPSGTTWEFKAASLSAEGADRFEISKIIIHDY